MPSKAKPLTDAQLRVYESKRDLAAGGAARTLLTIARTNPKALLQWLESDGRRNRSFHGIACGAR